MKKTTCSMFRAMKNSGTPISVVTAYDAPTAKISVEAGIDLLLVGDSVGTNVLGYESEKEVTMEDMLHHCKAVVRGAPAACVAADLPYNSASDPATASKNACKLVSAGADIVKLEGWGEQEPVVARLCDDGFSVCGHIGYNPQIHGQKARVFGKDVTVAAELIRSASALERAGASLLIVEKVPEEVCRLITEKLSIPVIGIGSGRFCDGQVLVFHDVVGLTERSFRHAKAYANTRVVLRNALAAFNNEIKSGHFPLYEHVSHVTEETVASLRKEPADLK